jgi:hypothetical protein
VFTDRVPAWNGHELLCCVRLNRAIEKDDLDKWGGKARKRERRTDREDRGGFISDSDSTFGLL